jgi:GNAT superfamily N-acetyltransferase
MYPLPRSEFHRFENFLDDIPFNTLFAQSVLKKKVSGSVYVDSLIDPAQFYIVHRYGMSLLYGAPDNEDFNERFGHYIQGRLYPRAGAEWMQTFPRGWDIVLPRLIENSSDGVPLDLDVQRRVNFKFNARRHSTGRALNAELDMLATTQSTFRAMEGSVVPASFWDSAEDFEASATGFDIVHRGRVISQAFSAFSLNGQLELGMETLPPFRHQGLARTVCGRLIGHCLEHKLEPVWACRESNAASFGLARALGFEPVFTLPYYRLPDVPRGRTNR